MTKQLPGFQRQTLGFHSASFGVPPFTNLPVQEFVSILERSEQQKVSEAGDRPPPSWGLLTGNRDWRAGQTGARTLANCVRRAGLIAKNANQQFWLVVLCNVMSKDQVGRLLNNIWCSLKLLYSILCFI